MPDSRERKNYKADMQKTGVTVPKAQHPVPMTANPVSKSNPGLGATTIAHPFKNGKSSI